MTKTARVTLIPFSLCIALSLLGLSVSAQSLRAVRDQLLAEQHLNEVSGNNQSEKSANTTPVMHDKAPSSPQSGQSTAPVLNDRLPFPVPAYGKSNWFGSENKDAITPLANVAPTGLDVALERTPSSLRGLTALRLTVKNNTDRPVSFNANAATATIGSTALKASPMQDLSDRIKQPDNPKGYFERSVENTVTSAISVGVVQAVNGEMRYRRSIADRYGFDNANRMDRLGRFGERVLWPGDSTVGLVYFKTDDLPSGTAIQIPIADFYNNKDNAVMPAKVR
jgi:hypothetical protein